MKRFLLTRRVLSTATVGFLAIALVWTVIAFADDAELIQTIALVSTVVLSAFAAGVALSAAARIPSGEPLRHRWILIGSGISLYALAQGVRIYYEYILGMSAPYPGFADALFALSGFAIAIGLFDAMSGVRRIGVRNAPLIAAVTVSLALLAIEANLLLLDVFAEQDMSPFVKAVTLYRPIGDVLLCVLPALYVVFAIAVSGGRLGWPWIPVAFGVVLIALTDAVYAWLSWNGSYRPGGISDLGLMLGYMFIALGALMHMEVDRSEVKTMPEPATDAA